MVPNQKPFSPNFQKTKIFGSMQFAQTVTAKSLLLFYRIPAKSNDLILFNVWKSCFYYLPLLSIFLYAKTQRNLMISSRYLTDELILQSDWTTGFAAINWTRNASKNKLEAISFSFYCSFHFMFSKAAAPW